MTITNETHARAAARDAALRDEDAALELAQRYEDAMERWTEEGLSVPEAHVEALREELALGRDGAPVQAVRSEVRAAALLVGDMLLRWRPAGGELWPGAGALWAGGALDGQALVVEIEHVMQDGDATVLVTLARDFTSAADEQAPGHYQQLALGADWVADTVRMLP